MNTGKITSCHRHHVAGIKRCITTIVLVAACALCVQAAGDDSTIFTRLSERLRAAVPDVIITTNETTLTASFQTMTFKIHGRFMTGEIEKEARDDVGPKHTGFILTASLQPKGEINQACTPQTLQRPYWLTDLDVTPVAGSDRQLYWGLSYGTRTDTNTLAHLRAAVRDLAATTPRPHTAEQAIAHRIIGNDEYQSFVGNWDEQAAPVLCALIRSPAEWDAVFHPAPLMRGKKPFGPEAKVFETEQVLIVARVMDAPQGDVFKVEQVSADGDVLTLRYTFTAPKAASYTVKQFLGLRVPKRDYAKVVVVENGKPVVTLDVKAGQCSVPKLPTPGKP